MFVKKESFKNFLFLIFCFALFIYVFVVNAWVCDDAYITFRVTDNLIRGFGPVYNIGERVQVYTSPLWFLLISFFYFFTREPYFTTLTISLFLNLFLLIIVFYFFKKNFFSFFLFLLLLINSKAFIDYSSSGLENPLAHLLIGIFTCVFLFSLEKLKNFSNWEFFFLFFIGGMGFLTRQDDILFFAPPLFYVFFKWSCQKSIGARLKIVFLALLPVILWLIFSVIYYGFPFPNTAYAKLNTTYSFFELVKIGFFYFLNSLKWDPLTLIIIFLALLFSFFSKEKSQKFLALGILFYLLYVLKIGGDFMSGRFFTGLFLASSLIIVKKISGGNFLYLIIFPLIFLMIINPNSPLKTSKNYRYLGEDKFSGISAINDEKGFYFRNSGLIFYFDKNNRSPVWPNMNWAIGGYLDRIHGKKGLFNWVSIGYYGYFCGPQIVVIDHCGLTSALLARIPSKGIVGHYGRWFPQGYAESVLFSQNLIKDPDLRLFYEKLLSIIKGPIFKFERFKNILEMNFGKYNYLVKRYMQKNEPVQKEFLLFLK